jgi:hypothetical protein
MRPSVPSLPTARRATRSTRFRALTSEDRNGISPPWDTVVTEGLSRRGLAGIVRGRHRGSSPRRASDAARRAFSGAVTLDPSSQPPVHLVAVCREKMQGTLRSGAQGPLSAFDRQRAGVSKRSVARSAVGNFHSTFGAPATKRSIGNLWAKEGGSCRGSHSVPANFPTRGRTKKENVTRAVMTSAYCVEKVMAMHFYRPSLPTGAEAEQPAASELWTPCATLQALPRMCRCRSRVLTCYRQSPRFGVFRSQGGEGKSHSDLQPWQSGSEPSSRSRLEPPLNRGPPLDPAARLKEFKAEKLSRPAEDRIGNVPAHRATSSLHAEVDVQRCLLMTANTD